MSEGKRSLQVRKQANQLEGSLREGIRWQLLVINFLFLAQNLSKGKTDGIGAEHALILVD